MMTIAELQVLCMDEEHLDKIIINRAGVTIMQDVEGGMAMVGVLCKVEELALSIGHTCLAVGDDSIILDSGSVRAAVTAIKVQEALDMFEVSTVRKEDWNFVADKCEEFVSVLQFNNAELHVVTRCHCIHDTG